MGRGGGVCSSKSLLSTLKSPCMYIYIYIYTHTYVHAFLFVYQVIYSSYATHTLGTLLKQTLKHSSLEPCACCAQTFSLGQSGEHHEGCRLGFRVEGGLRVSRAD